MIQFRPATIALILLLLSLLSSTVSWPNRALAQTSVPSIAIAHDDNEPTCNDSNDDGECDVEPPHD